MHRQNQRSASVMLAFLSLQCLWTAPAVMAKSPNVAFLSSSSGVSNHKNIQSRQRAFAPLYYATEPTEGSSTSSVFSKVVTENEWGIPHHSTLPRLGGGAPSHKKNRKERDQLPNGGRVTLMGAGVGDPDLLTVAAYKLLTDTDHSRKTLIVSDRLVSQEILDLIPGTTEVKIARKLPGCAELAQEEIYWWVHEGLQQGKHVIRLKIGDPFVFGRGGEEVLTFRNFGVESKVIPVSSI